MTTDTPPPDNPRCQVYGGTAVRCINTGTHWFHWGGGCVCTEPDANCEKDFYSWECDGPHLYGDTDSAFIPTQREAA